MKIEIPSNASLIIKKLENSGFECYAVGGCIRDCLMKKQVNDWDFATNADPDQIIDCFSDYTTFDIGKRYGTVCVMIDNEKFEITTYRTDGAYTDSRHPQQVLFSSSLHDDLCRRDFTVNALAYNDKTGIIDDFSGIDDLNNHIIRCINDPDDRFKEDALRILRALRFACIYGFSIEENTQKAIFCNKSGLNNVSGERITTELIKILCGKNVEYILNRYRDVFAVFIPELKTMFDYDQHTPHHDLSLYSHTARAVAHTAPDKIERVTMLMHDLGKPYACKQDSSGKSHFKGHPDISVQIAVNILKRLRFSNSDISKICTLVKYHDNRLTPDPYTVKSCMRDIGADATRMLLSIQYADIMAQSDYLKDQKLSTLSKVEKEFNRIVESDECYSLSQLCVNGSDIVNMVPDATMIGDILNRILDDVMRGTLNNTKQDLLLYAASVINNI